MLALQLPAASRAVKKNLLAQVRAVHKGSVRGLNRAAIKNRNDGSRIIRRTLNVKASLVKKQMRVKKAHLNKTQAAVQTLHKPIPLIEFNAVKQLTKVVKGVRRERGVSVKMRKDKPTIKFRNAFIRTMPNGRTGVFVRVGKERVPLKELKGPSVYATFADKMDEIIAVGNGYLARYLGEEIERELKRRF